MANIKSTIYRRVSSCSSYSSSSGTSDDDDDENKLLKPIKDYISNRKDLARELFRSVKAEKIRMMLPQTLKKVDFKELEEWCASELSGMSKSRILAILASTKMPQSSATSDSDDSGPSLEIISDTEAWISDSEQQTIKQEGQSLTKTSRNKSKRNRKKTKETSVENKTGKLKSGSIKSDDSSLTSIKREEIIKDVKPQEGESLLDLLELEMRARAIRALIRKEEDIIPNIDGEKSAVGSALKQTLNSIALHEKNVNDKENNGRKEAESKLVNIGEDEDLVLVVKPTPTISLLSSDGESDNSVEHTKKVLGNEHRTENKVLTTDERRVHVREKSSINPDTLEIVVTSQLRETNREKSVTCEKPVITAQLENSLNNQIKLSNEKSVKKIPSPKKLKKKQNTKLSKNPIDSKDKFEEKSKIPSTSAESKEVPIKKAIKVVHEETMLDKVVMIKKSTLPDHNPIVDAKVAAENLTNKPTLLTDNDYEEIIDLDAYPDDMDDMEMDENVSTAEKTVRKTEDGEIKPGLSTETWASRYYQTDSVQNVIKDSKIQSEIRKRLRERQKLSKLNNLKSITVESEKADVIESKATGSVEEYLALKAIADTSIPPDKNNSEDKQEVESSGKPAAAAVQLGQDDSDNTDNQIKDIERRAQGDREAVASVEIPQVIA